MFQGEVWKMTLRDYRFKLQILTGDMAKKLGINPSELCSIEHGKKASEELISKIKELYQIPEEDFSNTLRETENYIANMKHC